MKNLSVILPRRLKPRFEWHPRINKDHPLGKNLCGFWLFNENAGPYVYDIAGGMTGTFLRSTQWGSGKYGRAANFDGTTSKGVIKIPKTPRTAFPPGDLTLSIWFYLRNTSDQVIVVSGGATTGDIAVYHYNGGLYFLVSSYISYATGGAGNKWWHLVGTFNGGVNRLYVNGILRATSTPGWAPATNLNPLFVGCFNNAANDAYINQPVNGLVDHLAIWNYAMTAQQIFWLYNDPFAMINYPALLLYGPAGGTPVSNPASSMLVFQ